MTMQDKVFLKASQGVTDSGLTVQQEEKDGTGLGEILPRRQAVEAARRGAVLILPDGTCLAVEVRDQVLTVLRDGVEVSLGDATGLERELFRPPKGGRTLRYSKRKLSPIEVFPSSLGTLPALSDVDDIRAFFRALMPGDTIMIGYLVVYFVDFDPSQPEVVTVRHPGISEDVVVSTMSHAIRKVDSPLSVAERIERDIGSTARFA